MSQIFREAYHKAACKVGDFSPGATVRLKREPENPHDPFAVAVTADEDDAKVAAYVNKQRGPRSPSCSTRAPCCVPSPPRHWPANALSAWVRSWRRAPKWSRTYSPSGRVAFPSLRTSDDGTPPATVP